MGPNHGGFNATATEHSFKLFRLIRISSQAAGHYRKKWTFRPAVHQITNQPITVVFQLFEKDQQEACILNRNVGQVARLQQVKQREINAAFKVRDARQLRRSCCGLA